MTSRPWSAQARKPSELPRDAQRGGRDDPRTDLVLPPLRGYNLGGRDGALCFRPPKPLVCRSCGSGCTLGPRRGYPVLLSKRDYGQTTSSLLANMEHRYKRLLSAKDEVIFVQAAEIWRLHRILKEYSYAEADDPKEQSSNRSRRIRESLGGRDAVRVPGSTKRESDPI